MNFSFYDEDWDCDDSSEKMIEDLFGNNVGLVPKIKQSKDPDNRKRLKKSQKRKKCIVDSISESVGNQVESEEQDQASCIKKNRTKSYETHQKKMKNNASESVVNIGKIEHESNNVDDTQSKIKLQSKRLENLNKCNIFNENSCDKKGRFSFSQDEKDFKINATLSQTKHKLRKLKKDKNVQINFNNVDAVNKMHYDHSLSSNHFSEKSCSQTESLSNEQKNNALPKKKLKAPIKAKKEKNKHNSNCLNNDEKVIESHCSLATLLPSFDANKNRHNAGNIYDNNSEWNFSKNEISPKYTCKRKRDEISMSCINTKHDTQKVLKLETKSSMSKLKSTKETVVNNYANKEGDCSRGFPFKINKAKSGNPKSINQSTSKYTNDSHHFVQKPLINMNPNLGRKFQKIKQLLAVENSLSDDTIKNKTVTHNTNKISTYPYSSDDIKSKALEKLRAAKFRFLNEKMYTSTGSETLNLLHSDPDSFHIYHKGYLGQALKWPVNPVDIIIEDIKNMPENYVIADLGCGNAKIASTFPNRKVYSFDFIALNKNVTACDMSKVPIGSATVDISVFCLSLMGTNLNDYIKESHRILKIGGIMKIAEVETRFDDVDNFIACLQKFGFSLIKKDISNKMFIFLDLKKVKERIKKHKLNLLTSLQLKPCLYKRR